ncbi:NAD(P)H dehydrogenase [Capnocytophaga stomatis]|uniref:NAD(P)H-dependent oxidoreductase n=1 Tax=Capnocytophaga stomatis TaxID=1848904 RepID=UPI0019510FC9|nr:NAD(P)H-dependent oxidoreductase [Capnocytophaga stomatis]GIJ95633.1 NAD(P)H dehydrogenase [Capnocytophaga stomatis]
MKSLKLSLLLFCVILVSCANPNSENKKAITENSKPVVKVSETKILVISGHPDLSKSTANRIILSDLEKHFGSKISVRRLDEMYPDYNINIEMEEKSLINADVVMLQFPFYWYGTPALLKKWIDDVLLGFFDGNTAGKFKGKKVIVSLTTGAPQEAYEAPNQSVEAYLLPLKETFTVIGGKWLKPIFSCNYTPENQQAEKQAHTHAQSLINQIEKIFQEINN